MIKKLFIIPRNKTEMNTCFRQNEMERKLRIGCIISYFFKDCNKQ